MLKPCWGTQPLFPPGTSSHVQLALWFQLGKLHAWASSLSWNISSTDPPSKAPDLSSRGSFGLWRDCIRLPRNPILARQTPSLLPFSPQVTAKAQVMAMFSGVFAGDSLLDGRDSICRSIWSTPPEWVYLVGDCGARSLSSPMSAVTIVVIIIHMITLWSRYY